MLEKYLINVNDVDPNYNVFRYEKFKIDVTEKNITKICMTEIINADMTIATVGEELYAAGCKEVLTAGRDAIRQMGLSHCLIHYMHSYKNFIVAATDEISDEQFEKLMRNTYEQFSHSTSEKTELGALARFAVVFGGTDLVNRAKSTFYHHRKSQNNFLIASLETSIIKSNHKENIDMFNIINNAITNNLIIPYYQGMYNNNTGEIDKYEALMRIADLNGNIYVPAQFLDVSKKFKLYHTLSKMMIDKALTDFADKDSELSINISLFDVENNEFTEWFFKRMHAFPNPMNLTIEFVETENYNTGEKLYNFLNVARGLGCKIAVDDFGVGFATYTSIISLKPDTIKIDGLIVKDLANNKDHQIILGSIQYMAKLINAEIVAEFVENAEIQEMLIAENVDYSQGYYFAKPLPLAKLDIK